MDNRVRDLDQIQERDGDDRGRRIGSILMATAAIVGLTFAVGVLVGRAAEPTAAVDDPLSKLEHHAAAAEPSAASTEQALPRVEAVDMTFPTALADSEDRPEVLEALQAAAKEEAALGDTAEPATPAPAAPKVPMVDAVVKAKDPAPALDTTPGADDEDEAVAAAPAAARFAATLPASVAAGTAARGLPQAPKHDKLVADAMLAETDLPKAPHGHDGEFTLQVISYERPEQSRAFAENLRQKGHMAFVAAADVPDRGRYYRVRIGPFKSRDQAETYRRKFEDDEHMNTFVVRNVPDET
jgi:cell division septation protein DedD